jgi:hypothetical protein
VRTQLELINRVLPPGIVRLRDYLLGRVGAASAEADGAVTDGEMGGGAGGPTSEDGGRVRNEFRSRARDIVAMTRQHMLQERQSSQALVGLSRQAAPANAAQLHDALPATAVAPAHLLDLLAMGVEMATAAATAGAVAPATPGHADITYAPPQVEGSCVCVCVCTYVCVYLCVSGGMAGLTDHGAVPPTFRPEVAQARQQIEQLVADVIALLHHIKVHACVCNAGVAAV